MLDFAGRVAIVTGAGRGLGRAHALQLAARGCRVVVNDIASKGGRGPAHDVVREIQSAGGIALANEASVTTQSAEIVQAAVNAFGQLDILVNNAGTTDHGMFEDLSQQQYRDQMEIHYFAAVDLCRAAWPHLKKSGSGRIVNTTSGGMYGNPGISNYTGAKAALLGFSLSLAHEGRPFGINVNCIGPNGRTRLTDVMDIRIQKFLEAHFKPERIAAFVAWLAHQDTTVTNEVFEVGGGMIGRVRFAHQPFVHAAADTPEAWAEQAEAVAAPAELIPLSSAMDIITREFHEVDPAMDLSAVDLLEEE